MKKTNRFFILTFVITWLLWLPSVINTNLQTMPGILLLLGMFAGFVPSSVGLVMLRQEHGPNLREYLTDKIKLNGYYHYLIFLLVFPIHGILTLLFTSSVDQGFVIENPIPYHFAPIVFLQILLIGGALGEEFGWRGYAQDKLVDRFGQIKGTLVLGLLWSLWHLPLFFMEGTVQSHLPMWQFLLQNTILAYFYTWLYNKTNGNLTLMILLHAVMNTSAAVFPYWQSEIGRYIGLAGLLMILVILSVKEKFSPSNRSTG